MYLINKSIVTILFFVFCLVISLPGFVCAKPVTPAVKKDVAGIPGKAHPLLNKYAIFKYGVPGSKSDFIPNMKLYFDFDDGQPILSFINTNKWQIGLYDVKTNANFPEIKTNRLKIINLGQGSRFYFLTPEQNGKAGDSFIYDRKNQSMNKMAGYFFCYEDINKDGMKDICLIEGNYKGGRIIAYNVLPTVDNEKAVKKIATGKIRGYSNHDRRQRWKILYDEQMGAIFCKKLSDRDVQQARKNRKNRKNKKDRRLKKRGNGYDNLDQSSFKSTLNNILVKVNLDGGRKDMEIIEQDESVSLFRRSKNITSNSLNWYPRFFKESPVYAVAYANSLKSMVILSDREEMILDPTRHSTCASIVIEKNLYCDSTPNMQTGAYTLESGATLHFGFSFDNNRLNFINGFYDGHPFVLAVDKKRLVLFAGHMSRIQPKNNKDYSSSYDYPNFGYQALKHLRMYDLSALLSYEPLAVNSFLNYIFVADKKNNLHIYTPALEINNNGASTPDEKW